MKAPNHSLGRHSGYSMVGGAQGEPKRNGDDVCKLASNSGRFNSILLYSVGYSVVHYGVVGSRFAHTNQDVRC